MRKTTIIVLILFSFILTSCGTNYRGTKPLRLDIPSNIIKIEVEKYSNINDYSVIAEVLVDKITLIEDNHISYLTNILSKLSYKTTYKKINKKGYKDKMIFVMYFKEDNEQKVITYNFYEFSFNELYFEDDGKTVSVISYRLMARIIYELKSIMQEEDSGYYE